MNNDLKMQNMEYDERKLADKVADEILQDEEKNRKKFVLLFLFFLICLIFLISSVTFAIMSTTGNKANVINTGSVLFSYDECGNNIEISNAFPMADEVGKSLVGEKKYFDFEVSVGFNKTSTDAITYELSLIPDYGNTLDPKYIRIYLIENGKEVQINNKVVNNFTDLGDSAIRNNAKLLLRRTTDKEVVNKYVLRMWLSNSYNVDAVSKVFKVTLGIDVH